MKAVVAAFNQEKALVGAFSVITNLRMELFQALEGTLLPLWKFSFERSAGSDTTALCWCPGYSDLFAASFGSCELKVSIFAGKACHIF